MIARVEVAGKRPADPVHRSDAGSRTFPRRLGPRTVMASRRVAGRSRTITVRAIATTIIGTAIITKAKATAKATSGITITATTAPSTSTGAACALLLSVQVVRHRQHMTVMNMVWPVSTLFETVAVVWAYFRYGRRILVPMSSRRHRSPAPCYDAAAIGKGPSPAGASPAVLPSVASPHIFMFCSHASECVTLVPMGLQAKRAK